MNGVLKVLDTMGQYVANLEQDILRKDQEIADLKAQLQAATKAEA